MDDSTGFVLIGCFIGFTVGCVLSILVVHYRAGISDCEIELPRDQYCKLIAVPNHEKN